MTAIGQRAALLAAIRSYFAANDVVEVVTRTLRPYSVTDPHLNSLAVEGEGYLQTSPEYAMKILLAAHGASMYQICPAFRGEERGARHQVEFQMLEWYRVGFSLSELMDDLLQLLMVAGAALDSANVLAPVSKVSYRSLFEAKYRVNPHQAGLNELHELCVENGYYRPGDRVDKADCLDMLFSAIDRDLASPTIVYDYPVCQAALAETGRNTEGDVVCFRFELFAAGLEIANAYKELNNAGELRTRFAKNNERRKALSLPVMSLDEEFLSVVDRVPDCAGIALGIDRLLMALTGAQNISDVST